VRLDSLLAASIIVSVAACGCAHPGSVRPDPHPTSLGDVPTSVSDGQPKSFLPEALDPMREPRHPTIARCAELARLISEIDDAIEFAGLADWSEDELTEAATEMDHFLYMAFGERVQLGFVSAPPTGKIDKDLPPKIPALWRKTMGRLVYVRALEKKRCL